jgi:hypothetical protein
MYAIIYYQKIPGTDLSTGPYFVKEQKNNLGTVKTFQDIEEADKITYSLEESKNIEAIVITLNPTED